MPISKPPLIYLRATLLALFVAVILAAPSRSMGQQGAPGVVALQSLVQQMLSRDSMAEFPAYANNSGVESSKDPLARTQYFYSDTDGGNFQRDMIGASGGTEHVMLDITGPGALTRLFVAGPSFGGHNIRIYLDGNTAPVLTADLNGLMTGQSFVGAPFVYAAGPNTIYVNGVGNVPPGLDLYLPIPFATHALVTYDGPANVNDGNQPQPILDFVWEYTRYLPGTGVTSFNPSQYSGVTQYANQFSATANTTLPGSASYTADGLTTICNQTLYPGASCGITVSAPSGGGALRLLQANAGTSFSNLEGVNLRVDYDGNDSSAINESIGDFFGSGEGLHVGTTQMQSVGADGTMTECWTMPYQSSITLTLTNNSSSSVPVQLYGSFGSYAWDSYSMHFHAIRRINGPMYIPSLAHTMRMMYILGTGLLVGDSESVVNAQPPNDTNFNWWGEGDELIYVDRTQFPTHRGTGSEDYFGYAYGHTTLFQSPWTSQTSVAPQNGNGFKYDGVTVLNRNRLLDVVPFNSSLRYDFEIHENSDSGAQIEVDHTSYFYVLPPSNTVSAFTSLSVVPDGPQSGKIFSIENNISGWLLTANSSTSVVTGIPTQTGSQRFAATSIGGNQYTLQNVGTGLYLSSSGSGAGAALALNPLSGSMGSCDQQWTITNVYDSGTNIPNQLGNGYNGYQSLVNSCGYAADVVGASTQAGTTIQQYTVNGSEAQIWRFNFSPGPKGTEPILPNGIYEIRNTESPGLAMDVPNASLNQSQPLQVYNSNGTNAQLWTLNYIANGVYSLVNVNSNLALDNGGQFSTNSNAVQYPYTGGTNQQWRIIAQSPSDFFFIQNVANGYYLSMGTNQTAGSPLVQDTIGQVNWQAWNFQVVTYP